jgi:CubicO group peptidase (beta-lactamase class C family)
MTDTGLFTSQSQRLPTLYLPTPTGLVTNDAPDGLWSRPPRFGDAAAGLVSTVDDLHTFARMLLAGGAGVLTPELAAAMVSDQLTPAQKAFGGLGPRFFDRRGWGFGLSVTTSGPRAGSYGWDGALGTSLLIDPGRDLVVIVLTQRMWEPAHPPPVFAAIQRAAYGPAQ